MLNRPDARNALTAAAWRRLAAVMHGLTTEESLRCIVLRGAGDRAFSAGADSSEFAAVRGDSGQARNYAELVQGALAAISACRHPTVALILGACESEGLALAAACDLRICSDSSTFGLPAGRLGIALGPAELEAIRNLAGAATALELLLEGRMLAAPEAYRKHLVNRVAADGAAEREAYAAAERIVAGAPLAARWNKQFIARLATEPRIARTELEAGWACCDTEDYRTALGALGAGAKPRFEGR